MTLIGNVEGEMTSWSWLEVDNIKFQKISYSRQRKAHPQPVGNRAITFCYGKVITCNGERPSGSASKSSYKCKAYNATTDSWDNLGTLDGGWRR